MFVSSAVWAQDVRQIVKSLPSDSQAVIERLGDLDHLDAGEWKFHAGDVPHGESLNLDDSSWQTVRPGFKASGEAAWFRRWVEVPKTLHGYDLTGTRIWFRFQASANGPMPQIIYFNGNRVALGDDLEPIVLVDKAKPGDKILIAVKLMQTVDQKTFGNAEFKIDFTEDRPNPDDLRKEFLSAAVLVPSLSTNQQGDEATLEKAIHAVDLKALDSADQSKFDASLKAAASDLESLKQLLKQATFHLTGNSHIDAAWLWPWTETVDVVKRTFSTALQLMNEYPNYTYTQSAAAYNYWMATKYPNINNEIKKRIKEGRWEIVGGMWVEPDLNMPSGEATARSILLGKRFYKQEYGVDVRIGWNPDSFGYNWQLPQIYKKSGIDYFVTQKLLWAHEFTTFPYKLFWWESPDGSRLLTYFPHDYGSMMEPVSMAEDVSVWMPSIYHNTLKDPEMLYLYGIGDHGGGPTRTMLDNAERLMSPGVVFPKLEFSNARSFLDDVAHRSDLEIPVWKSELYFQYHRGVFTTQSETKKLIRQTEEKLLDTEKYASLAQLYQRPYPRQHMTVAWKGLLFDQFHDIMPGSGIAINYVDARRDLENVGRIADGILGSSIDEISARIDTHQPGTPVVIYNSLSWARTDVVEVEAQLPEATPYIEVVDSSARPVPFQILSNDLATHRVRFLLLAATPELGYATYFVRPAAKEPQVTTALRAASTQLENEFLKVTIDPRTGCITSLYDKHTQQEALAKPETDTGGPKNFACGNLLQAFVDKPKEYDAWNIDADFENQFWNLDKADEVKLIESGPLRAVMRVKHHFQNSGHHDV